MIRLVSKLLVALVLVGFVATASMAQETENIIRPSTKSGSAAMYFSFGGLSDLGINGVQLAGLLFPGEGTVDGIKVIGAGGKFYISDDLAIRGLLAFATSSKGDADLTKSANGKVSTTQFGVGAGIELHTRPVYSISPYFGGQVAFASANQTTTKNLVAKTGGKISTLATTTSETKLSASGFGIEVLAGFDWYVFRGIAIGAEYGLNFSTASASSTSGGTTTDVPSATSIAIGVGSVHLLVHF